MLGRIDFQRSREIVRIFRTESRINFGIVSSESILKVHVEGEKKKGKAGKH